MDRKYTTIKTGELKGSTFRSHVLNFGDFDISEYEFATDFADTLGHKVAEQTLEKFGNTVVLPLTVLEGKSGNIRADVWMTKDDVRDLAVRFEIMISSNCTGSSDTNEHDITITFEELVIPVTVTQGIVNINLDYAAADQAAENANNAATVANTAAENADEKAQLANTAATNANEAAGFATQATQEAATATGQAQAATSSANSAATAANSAATNANDKAAIAQTAANNADAKAAAAQTATTNANTATGNANTAASAANTAAQNALSGIKDEATPTTVPSATEFERYIVHTAGTYTNFLSGGSPIVVTAADLDVVNGVANNRVILRVNNGVAKKIVERVKGDAAVVNYNTGTLSPTSTDKAETGKTVGDYVAKFTRPSVNLINTLLFQAGYYNVTTGGYTSSVNWLSTPRMVIPDNVKGQKVTVSGGGSISTTTVKAVIRDINGTNLLIINRDASSTVYPYTFEVPINAHTWGFTVKNEVGIGNNLTNNIYVNSFQVQLGEVATTFEKFGDLFIKPNSLPESTIEVKYDLNEIVLKKIGDNSFNLYFYSGAGKWFMAKWFRHTNAVKYSDTWRLNEGWICSRNGDDFTPIEKVILSGVWENAIYTSGASYTDALGSAHGWETFYNCNFYIDGELVDPLGVKTIYKGAFFEAVQGSNFVTVDNSAVRAKSMKKWEVKNGVIKINNSIQWLMPTTVTANSYLSMCSLLRKSEDGTKQITDTATANNNYLNYDVSEEGFTTEIFSDGNNPKRTSIIVWGDFVKVEMEVSKREVVRANGTILPKGFSDAGMYIQNTALYNKIYGRFGSDSAGVGDVYNVETIYRINSL